MTAPTIPQIIDTLDDLRRMGLANCYPAELLAARRISFLAQVERYSIGARLDDIAAAFVTADPETRQELITEAAELLTKEDCDANPE
jgi:ABC-type transport system substrate-binding protein